MDEPDERPRKWHDTPGAGRPELRWRIVRGFTLGFSVVTVVLTEENGKTRLNATSEYPSREVRDMVLSTGMEKGAAISYDNLDKVSTELLNR